MSNHAKRYKQDMSICYTCGAEGDSRVFQHYGDMAFCSYVCNNEYAGVNEEDNHQC